MNFQNTFYNVQQQALLDENFLAALAEEREREIYARIIALDINENPIDQIEGKVTNGSINIDGNSIVRRTCNLTMISDNIDINEYYWGVKTKFKLEIGLRNKLTGIYASSKKNIYPEIIWFSQGYYIISTFNTSITINNCTISLSGKDKMCLLNGDLGGQLFASIDFGKEEEINNIMEEVFLTIKENSEGVTLNNYYIKPEDNLPEKILLNDSRYVFIYDKTKNGKYYKKDHSYILRNPEITETHLKYYDMYKLIDNPNDLYILINDIEDYQKNEYYYKVGSNYQKDISEKPSKDRQYYKIIGTNNPVAVEIYAPDKYYYKKYDDDNLQYYILDSSVKRNSNRNYYKLLPVYQKFNDITITKINLEKIIREAVHTYAKEPYYNIIIRDLDNYGLEQLTYKGDTPLYALFDKTSQSFVNLILGGETNKDFEAIINQNGFQTDPLTNSTTSYNGSQIVQRGNKILGMLAYNNDILNGSSIKVGTYNPETDKLYTVVKIDYGTDVGYRLTDLTYTGDLISSIGETLTSILDKIKNMLGDFEYFYDENGRFIFQRKKIYINTSWSQLTDNEDEKYVNYANDESKVIFNFEGGRLISAIQNSPVLNNLRNDFIVWGKRKGVSGADIPIHARYAIDKKPVYYKALNNHIYTTDVKYAVEQNIIEEDNYINISEELTERVRNFNLDTSYVNKMIEYGLIPPQKNDNDLSWTPGWWDIRDWAKYYKLLKYDNADAPDPNGTMKFYSSGDENGCISIQEVKNNIINNNGSAIINNTIGHVWLIEIDKITKQVNLAHGSGVYNPNNTRPCIYYETDIQTHNNIKTTKTQNFPTPYSGCSDTHTYQYFLEDTDKYDIYFYNPKFPFGENEKSLIEKQIANKYNELEEKNGIHIVDWREIIYQMALDYFAGQGCSIDNPLYIGKDVFDGNQGWTITYYAMTDPDNFLYEVGQRNPYYYPTGYTGYEQYYTDMQGFWRQLYNPDYIPKITYSTGKYINTIQTNESTNINRKIKSWISPQIEDYEIEFYVSSIKEAIQIQKNELNRLIADTPTGEYKNLLEKLNIKYEKSMPDLTNSEEVKKLYWNQEVFSHPENLNFWIDFFDSDTELAQYSISQIGDRTKVINEDKSHAIIYSEVPDFILYDKNAQNNDGTCNTDALISQHELRREIIEKSGYNFIYLPKGLSKFFTISYRTISLKDKIDELIYQYGYCTENITITAMPVYHLKVNNRIFVCDKNTGVNGEYFINKITLPLTHNGTMSITAIKAPERLY